MIKLITWRFRATPETHVLDLDSIGTPTPRVIGKRWDPETEAYVLDESNGHVSVEKRLASIPRGHYARALSRGDLLPGDAETAAAFGMPVPVTLAPLAKTTAKTTKEG